MFINRVHLSKIIGTKPSNIRKTKKTNNEILIYLWDYDKVIKVKIEEYNNFIEKSKKSKSSSEKSLTLDEYKEIIQRDNAGIGKSEGSSKKAFGAILLVTGLILILMGVNIDTSVNSQFGRVSNIGKMNEKNNTIVVGGFIFLSGIILVSTSNPK